MCLPGIRYVLAAALALTSLVVLPPGASAVAEDSSVTARHLPLGRDRCVLTGSGGFLAENMVRVGRFAPGNQAGATRLKCWLESLGYSARTVYTAQDGSPTTGPWTVQVVKVDPTANVAFRAVHGQDVRSAWCCGAAVVGLAEEVVALDLLEGAGARGRVDEVTTRTRVTAPDGQVRQVDGVHHRLPGQVGDRRDLLRGRGRWPRPGPQRRDPDLLVTIDGRDPRTSIGVTAQEAAGVMQWLGAEDALSMGIGGDTTLVSESGSTLYNRPMNSWTATGPTERKVGNAVVVVGR